jgi:hypothetical protein
VNHCVRFELTIDVDVEVAVSVQQVRETASMLTLPALQVSPGLDQGEPLVQVQP